MSASLPAAPIACRVVARVGVTPLWRWIRAALHREGLTAADAGAVARNLVHAEMRGVRSHGLLLLPVYQQRIADGGIRADARASLVTDDGARSIWDAGGGPGQAIAFRAMNDAIGRAKRFGAGSVFVRNGNHVGMLASYGELAARRGFVALVLTNTGASMRAPDGHAAAIGNNALCFAAPVRRKPLVIDMATGLVSCGKVRLAALHGEPLPPEWLMDARGIDNGGTVVPAGGFKGFGMAMMVDVLTSLMSGGATSIDVRRQRMETRNVTGACQAYFAWSLDGLPDGETFEARLERYLEALRAKSMNHCVPGDPERRASERVTGIGLTPPILDLLGTVAERARIEPLRVTRTAHQDDEE